VAKLKTAVPFSGTAEQEKQLLDIIASHKETPGALMPVLQEAQELYAIFRLPRRSLPTA
jgi:NADH:ubiquinone oxidoreductase subunit E